LQTGTSADAAVTSVVATVTSAIDWSMSLAIAFAVLVGGALRSLQDWKNVEVSASLQQPRSPPLEVAMSQ
jgi:hypothetical protein